LRCREGDVVLITFLLQGKVAQPTVGVDDATQLDRVLHKRHEALGGSIDDLTHPNPTDPRPILLSSNNNQGLFQIQPTRQSFLQAAYIAFIHLDSAAE
jgi:hypothetical protein